MTRRRVLVVGSYPPVPLPEAAATAAAVAVFATNGDEVEILAPRPCAAHHTASFHSWRGALALARLARRFDVVVLRLEGGFPVTARHARWRRAAGLASLGLALRTARSAVVHIEDLAVVPRPLGGIAASMLWGAAGTVTVRSEAEREELVGLTGIDRRRVVVELLACARSPELPDPGKLTPGDGRHEVMQIVAGRARIDRASTAMLIGARPPIDPLGPVTSVWRARAKAALEKTIGPRALAVVARVRHLLVRG